MQEARTVSIRSIEIIVVKIKGIRSSYKRADQIKSQTGQLMDNVYTACKHWDILDPILGCCPSVQPLFTNKQEIVDVVSPILAQTPMFCNSNKSAANAPMDMDSDREDAMTCTHKSCGNKNCSAQQVRVIYVIIAIFILDANEFPLTLYITESKQKEEEF
jgi:hypothetical protein